MLKEQYNFYRELYGLGDLTFNANKFAQFSANMKSPKLSPEQVKMLDNEISEIELKTAVFEMKKNKVPGSDGLGIEFYQQYFQLIKQLLLYICKASAKYGLHTTARQGIITLIEKPGKNLDYLTNWRPLSLLNCDGKVFTKVLALRLENVTGSILHIDQSGFQ